MTKLTAVSAPTPGIVIGRRPARLAPLGAAQDAGVERLDPLLQALADREQRRDRLPEPGPTGGKLTHARVKPPVAHLPDDLAERLQHAAYLGPGIASQVDEPRARDDSGVRRR